MSFRNIVCAFKMFWFGLWHPDFLNEQIFVAMSKLFEFTLEVSTKNRPFCTHLYMSDKRIVSLWAYPGISKNPVDRITELLREIDALMEAAQQPITAKVCNCQSPTANI
jgi:hypothetical protein